MLFSIHNGNFLCGYRQEGAAGRGGDQADAAEQVLLSVDSGKGQGTGR